MPEEVVLREINVSIRMTPTSEGVPPAALAAEKGAKAKAKIGAGAGMGVRRKGKGRIDRLPLPPRRSQPSKRMRPYARSFRKDTVLYAW